MKTGIVALVLCGTLCLSCGWFGNKTVADRSLVLHVFQDSIDVQYGDTVLLTLMLQNKGDVDIPVSLTGCATSLWSSSRGYTGNDVGYCGVCDTGAADSVVQLRPHDTVSSSIKFVECGRHTSGATMDYVVKYALTYHSGSRDLKYRCWSDNSLTVTVKPEAE
jgi:hypothetical protein